MRDRIAAHVVAACLIAAAFAGGVFKTSALELPAGADAFRDVASALAVQESFGNSIRHGTPLDDPSYKGEKLWYPPLLPAILALGSTGTGLPVTIVAARLPAYLNLGTPIAFYLLLVALFDPIVAVAGLTILLFVQPFQYWQTSTYSPWLNTGGFAQVFVFAGLLAWVRFERRPSHARAAVIGALGGLAFLTHTAAAAILAIVVGISLGILVWTARASKPDVRTFVPFAGTMAVTSLVLAWPALSVPWHYGGRMLNTRPMTWTDPMAEPDRWHEYLVANVSPLTFTIPALIGLVWLIRHPPTVGRRLVLMWGAVAFVLCLWAGFGWRVTNAVDLRKFALAPAHHFLAYLRAAECVFGAFAVVAIGREVQKRSAGRVPAALTAAVLLVGMVALSLDGYRHRNDEVPLPVYSESQAAAVAWIARETRTTDVFLAPENTGLSMIGAVGRKTAIVDVFFSNPYLSWEQRSQAVQATWDLLEKEECGPFAAHAATLAVTVILTVEGMTPKLADGTCGIKRQFSAPPFEIFRLR